MSSTSTCGAVCGYVEGCAAFLFKDYQKFKNENDIDDKGNCYMKSRYEVNVLGESIDFDEDYELYHCMMFKDKNNQDLKRFVQIPRVNLMEEAKNLGYNLTLKLEKQKTVKHIQILNGQLTHEEADRKCSSLDGSLLMEYSQEVRDALANLLGNQLPLKRHLALGNMIFTNRHIFHWADGRVERVKTIDETCPTLKHFNETELLTYRKTHLEGNKYQPGDLTGDELPDISICEYLGKNLVPGKRYLSHSTKANAPGKEVIGDNDWSWIPWAGDINTGEIVWFAIDFGVRLTVRMFRWQGSHWDHNMHFYLSDLEPVEGEEVNVDPYLLCAVHPEYHGYVKSSVGEILGVTCKCLVTGRYAIILHDVTKNPLHLGEVAVYGFQLE